MGTQVADSGCSYLTTLHNLRYLFMLNTQITDEGLGIISQMTKLRGLDLSGSLGITDAGLYHLTTLKELGRLKCVSAENVSEEALKWVWNGIHTTKSE